MIDRIFTAFLWEQYRQGMALAAASDILDLVPLWGDSHSRSADDRDPPDDAEPPRRYVARFRCTGLVKSEIGEIVEADRFVVGIWLTDDHLSVVDPATVVTVLEPQTIFAPNAGAPFMCLGSLPGGTSLPDILYGCFEIIIYAKVTMDERKALNHEACQWARRNMHRFPLDRRPLKRRAASAGPVDFDVALTVTS